MSSNASPTAAIQRKTHLDSTAITLLVVCCAFWGFQQILIKFAGREIAPLWQASIRMAGATALLWLWCQYRGVKLFERDGSLKGGLLVGALFAIEFCFIYLGLGHTSASRLTVFLYTSPFWVAIVLPRFVPGETMRRSQWIGLTIAFAAVGVAFSEAFLHGNTTYPHSPPLHGSLPPGGAESPWGGPAAPLGQWVGDLMGLAAGAAWGLTTVAIRSTKIATVSAEKSLFYQLGVTALVTPVLSLARGESWGFDYSAMAWGSVFLQTAVGAFASYLTWMWMLRHYPATRMATFTFLTPLFALVFGVVLLNEPLTLQLVLALVGVGAGIVLVNRR